MNPIKHVAIIMDGNGRWGIKHKNSRNSGHRAGLNTVETVIEACVKEKIVQTFTDEHIELIDTKVESKEKEIMTI